MSEQVVEVDGAPWHVRNLRQRRENSAVRGDDRADDRSHQRESDDSPLLVRSGMQSLMAQDTGIGSSSSGAVATIAGEHFDVSEEFASIEAGDDAPQELRRSERSRSAPDRWGYS